MSGFNKEKLFEFNDMVYLEKNYDDPEIKAMWGEWEDMNELFKRLQKKNKRELRIINLIFWVFQISLFATTSYIAHFELCKMIFFALCQATGMVLGYTLSKICPIFIKKWNR